MSEDRLAAAIAEVGHARVPDAAFADELFDRFVAGIGPDRLAVLRIDTDLSPARARRQPTQRSQRLRFLAAAAAVAALLALVSGLLPGGDDEGGDLSAGIVAGVPFTATVSVEAEVSRGKKVTVAYRSPSTWRMETVEASGNHAKGSYMVSDGEYQLDYDALRHAYTRSKLDPRFGGWLGINGVAGYIEPSAWDRVCSAVEPLAPERLAGRPTKHFYCRGPVKPLDEDLGTGVPEGEYWTDAETGLVLKQVLDGEESATRAITDIDYSPDLRDSDFDTTPPVAARKTEDLPPDPEPADEALALRMGEAPPDWNAQLIGGSEFGLSAQRGRPVALLFWAPWCDAACTGPGAITTFAEHADRSDVVMVSVGTMASVEDIAAAVSERGYTFPVAADADSRIAQELWRVDGLPFWTFVRADGTVAGWHLGSVENLDQVLDALAGGERLPEIEAP